MIGIIFALLYPLQAFNPLKTGLLFGRPKSKSEPNGRFQDVVCALRAGQ